MIPIPRSLSELRPLIMLLYLSALGYACVRAAQLYLGLEPSWAVALASMGLIFSIYLINHFTDTREDFTNDLGKALFFSRSRNLFAVAVAVLAGVVAVLLFARKLGPFHLALIGTGLCYSYRIIPWYSPGRGLRYVRIKEMTFVKNLTVSLLWSSSVFAVPILFAGPAWRGPDFRLLCLGYGLFLSTLNSTVFDDIQDEAGDRLAGVRTLPTLIGKRRTYRLLLGLDALSAATFAGLALAGALDWRHAGFLVLLGAYGPAYMLLHERKLIPAGVTEFLAESDLLFYASGLAWLCQP